MASMLMSKRWTASNDKVFAAASVLTTTETASKFGATAKNIATLAVLGISGPERVKGIVGPGKSTLCNRLVRPTFEDFSLDHISCLSHADFLCSTINSEHWLYWGECDLLNSISIPEGYKGRTTQLRIVEHTAFLDDESFEQIGNAKGLQGEYLNRALQIQLYSPGKLCYISKDQLGQEADFRQASPLPNGRTTVDAFCIVYDVSFVEGRTFERQSAFVLSLLTSAVRTKKPVFLVATKFDRADVRGVQEFQQIVQRKELLKHFGSGQILTAEVSALETVNISDLLFLVAFSLDKQQKGRPKMNSYSEASLFRRQKLSTVRTAFQTFLEQIIPKEEYIAEKSRLSWPILLSDFSITANPIYQSFIEAFGQKAAASVFENYRRVCQEWWFERDLTLRLPAFCDVLRRLFNRSFLCQIRWDQLIQSLREHPEFPTYFKPIQSNSATISSVDNNNRSSLQDDRLPSEILNRMESRKMFGEFQQQLLNEIALERQAEKFRQLLANKDAITPGRSFQDARVLVDEIAAFEKVLPPEHALRIYEAFQEKLKEKAWNDFMELLLENIELFIDLVVDWHEQFSDEQHPKFGLTSLEETITTKFFNEDKRNRKMSGISSERQQAISHLINFISLPLERNCPLKSLCSDLQLGVLFENFMNSNSSSSPQISIIDLHIFATDSDFADTFVQTLQNFLDETLEDGIFPYNSQIVQFSITRIGKNLQDIPLVCDEISERVSSLLFILTCPEDVENIRRSGCFNLKHPYLPPVFIEITNSTKVKSTEAFHKLCRLLAMEFHGTQISFNLEQAKKIPRSFRDDQIVRVLGEVCAIQLDSGHSDAAIRMSLMCADLFPYESLIMPFLERSSTSRIDTSGKRFFLDTYFPGLKRNARLQFSVGSYHSWMFGKWPLNSVHGHILVYSAARRASWRHAKCAIRLLMETLGTVSNDSERKSMARSIMLIAVVSEPNDFYTDKNVNRYVRKGIRLSEKLGCEFMTVSPSKSSNSCDIQNYMGFFERVLNNPFLPAEYYMPTSRGIFKTENFDETSFFGACHTDSSTLTGSASTLIGSGDEDTAEVLLQHNCCGRRSTTTNTEDRATIATTTNTAEARLRCEHCVKFRRKSYQSKRVLIGTPVHKVPPPPAESNESDDIRKNRLYSAEEKRRSIKEKDHECDDRSHQNEHIALEKKQMRNGFEFPFGRKAHSKNYGGQQPSSTLFEASSTMMTPDIQQANDIFFSGDIPFVKEEEEEVGAEEFPTPIRKGSPTTVISSTDGSTAATLTPNILRSQKINKIILAGIKHIRSSISLENSPVASPMLIRNRTKPPLQRHTPVEHSLSGEKRTIGTNEQLLRPSDVEREILNKPNIVVNNSNPKRLTFKAASNIFSPTALKETIHQDGINNNFCERKKNGKKKRRSRSVLRLPSLFTLQSAAASGLGRGDEVATKWRLKSSPVSPAVESLPPKGTFSASENEYCMSRSVIVGNSMENDCEVSSCRLPIVRAKSSSLSGPLYWLSGSQKSASKIHRQQKPFSAQNSVADIPSKKGFEGSPAASTSVSSSSSASTNSVLGKNKAGRQKSLEIICQNPTGLPIFMVKCIEFIEKNGGLQTEGIYRVPGQAQALDMEKAFKRPEKLDLDRLDLPVQTVASSLKKFLDMLQEPLVPVSVHSKILGGGGEVSSEVPSPETILMDIPEHNRNVLSYLLRHLNQVACYSHVNAMDARNLAKVWSPTVFRPSFDSFETMSSSLARFELAMLELMLHSSDSKFS